MDKWEKKYIKTNRFIPFGSLMNAYSQLNKGKGMEVEKFKEVAYNLFKFSQKLSLEAMREADNYERRQEGKQEEFFDARDQMSTEEENELNEALRND